MAHQSLYRRYRPRRFAEIRGQEHVVRALRNAVASGTEGHAYLFSGPRGTGKTSTARILAKALNCENLTDGEPCCECESCLAIEAGRSFDLFELDAASNRRIDDIRELIQGAIVGSPGRTKVYILDEVHMLTDQASNALLKTLEEPPEGVRFVLATTDPQKVLPTIRSRTQHYDFQLLSAQELEDYVRWIAQDAGLDVDEASIAHVVRAGKGSARDTLSALDQVVAAGGVVDRSQPIEGILGALADGDTGAAITAVAEALAQGSEPRTLAEALVAELRDTFLVSLGVPVPHLVDSDRERLDGWARRIGTARLTAGMEAIGSALVDMRQAADPRVPLEVALVRLTAGGSDSVDALVRRIEQLEASIASGSSPSAAAPAAASGPVAASPARPQRPATAAAAGSASAAAPSPQVPAPGPPPPRPRRSAGRAEPAAAKPAAAAAPTGPATAPEPAPAGAMPAPPAAEKPAPAAAPVGTPDRDALTIAFGDVVVPQLKGIAKAIYSTGRFVAVTDEGAVFALDNAPARDRAEKYRETVESALAAHFGTPVKLVLIEESDSGAYEGAAGGGAGGGAGSGGSGAPGAPRSTETSPGGAAPTADAAAEPDVDEEDPSTVDLSELRDADDVATSGIERLTQAFPGSVLLEDGTGEAGHR